jgi:serine/threonine-protein kinase
VIAQRPAPGREIEEGSTVTLVASTGPAERTIPEVVGETERTAVRELTQAGFRVETEERPSAAVARGRAIGTRPPAGTEVSVGERVRLLISSGPRRVEVPDVVGLTRSSAEAVLERRGLGVKVERARSDEPKGEVLGQTPDSGRTVDEGTTVAISVSTGPSNRRPAAREPAPPDRGPTVDRPAPESEPTATVPGVVGLSARAAASRLRAAGFGVSSTTRPVSDEENDGIVLRQAPGAGAERRVGSTVRIVVGRMSEAPPEDGDLIR